jgi:hypothetical protein
LNSISFETVTGLPALKRNAIQVCGKEFIDSLKLYAKNDDFWIEVNRHLDIPDDAYEQKLAREKEEQERKEAEKQAEKERLLNNKKAVRTKTREDWKITVFELPESKIYGKQYMAEGINLSDSEKTVYSFSWGNNVNQAYCNACNSIDSKKQRLKELERRLEEEREYKKYYNFIKIIYLMLLYLSGWDEYNPYLSNSEEKRCKENFTGVRSWIGLDFNILNKLEREKLIEQPQREGKNYKKVTYVELTKKGMQLARETLKNINLEGAEPLLEQLDYHEEYIAYQSHIDIMREEDDDDDDCDNINDLIFDLLDQLPPDLQNKLKQFL